MRGAREVKVTYRDRQTPIINVKDAVARQSFFSKKMKDLIVGDAESEWFINFVWGYIH